MLTKEQISRLRGGPKHNFQYFVGISESAESDVLTDIVKVKLVNQMGSQRSIEFPDGYEPFAGTWGRGKFDLDTMTIPVPRLKLRPVGWPNSVPTPQIVPERKLACVFNPSSCTEAFEILNAEAQVSEINHGIRSHAKKRHALDLVLSLMIYPGGIPLMSDPAERFEAYLNLRSPEFLRDLLVLLDMPDSAEERVGPELHKTA